MEIDPPQLVSHLANFAQNISRLQWETKKRDLESTKFIVFVYGDGDHAGMQEYSLPLCRFLKYQFI